MSNNLLSSTSLNNISVNNRVIMAPLTRCRANNPELTVTDIHAKYYKQRANAGLIISEGTVVSPEATGYINVPGIYSDAQVEGWKKSTQAVHDAGGKIFAQLWHVGRLSHPDFHNGDLPPAPSALNPYTAVATYEGVKKSHTPRALTLDQIAKTIEDFANAGANAMKAGFDGVEVHAANGYLFHQFFSTCSNIRTDQYGGNIENRTRLLFEVIDAMSLKMPVEKIGVRLNPMQHDKAGIIVDEETGKTFDHIISRLNDYPLAYLHINKAHKILDEPYYIKDIIGHCRKKYKGFLIACGNFNAETAEKEIKSGRADAIAFGRPFISNPDLPETIRKGLPFVEPDEATYYTTGEVGYTDYE